MRSLRYKQLRKRLGKDYLERTEKYWDGDGNSHTISSEEFEIKRANEIRQLRNNTPLFECIHNTIDTENGKKCELKKRYISEMPSSRYDFYQYEEDDHIVIVPRYSYITLDPNVFPNENKAHEVIFKLFPNAVIIPR